MSFALRTAWTSLRGRPARALLTAGGVFVATLVLGVALTVAHALGTGFDRAAQRSDLPTIVARFNAQPRSTVDARVRALPNLAARAYRTEQTGVRLRDAEGHRTGSGVVQVVSGDRRGYAIVAGRDVTASGGVVIERGLARTWHLDVGDQLRVGRLGWMPIVGVAVSPDNVAFPLAKTARVTLDEQALLRRFGESPSSRFPVNVLALWAQDPARADVLIASARQTSYGLSSLRFLTASSVRALLEQAAGIVIALLVAFAAVAAGLSGVLLAAGAQSEVQRSLGRIGLQRALGATPRGVVGIHAARGALVAAPAAALGLGVGAVLAAGPASGVLAALNELMPSAAETAGVLLLVWLATVGLVVACSATPAWRAARRPAATLLRGGDVAVGLRGSRRWTRGLRGGLVVLGLRLVAIRRARLASIVVVLAAAAAVVLLLLALASLLTALQRDPATLGKRYQLTAALQPEAASAVAAIPGVEAAQPRFSAPATSGSSLGAPLQVIAYPGDHTRFEAPPLASGRRVRGPGEAEVGLGLADALGLAPGSTLVVQADAPREARFRVVGVVRSLQDEGRVAFVQPDRLERAGAQLTGPIAIRLAPDANRRAVSHALGRLGASANTVRGAAGSSAFLKVLASLLRIVAGTVALVCAYALLASLTLTTRERRGAVATLRAFGAGTGSLARLLVGAAVAVVAPAIALAAALEAFVLSPLVSHLAAGYADLPLGATGGQVAIVAAGLLGLGLLTAWTTAWRLAREPVLAGLREET